jgi:hypothetical protein
MYVPLPNCLLFGTNRYRQVPIITKILLLGLLPAGTNQYRLVPIMTLVVMVYDFFSAILQSFGGCCVFLLPSATSSPYLFSLLKYHPCILPSFGCDHLLVLSRT